MAILSFDGRVNIAVRIVNEEYPDAVLYEADGRATGGLTTDPAQINTMRVVFGNTGNTTVIIEETAYGEFGKPILVKKPWLEDIIIKWPIDMDLPEANELKEKAGYQWPYSLVTLRNPLGPTLGNPLFIFGGNPAEPFVFVDTVTKKVSSSMGFASQGKRLPFAPNSACSACTPLSACAENSPFSACTSLSACTDQSPLSACTSRSACADQSPFSACTSLSACADKSPLSACVENPALSACAACAALSSCAACAPPSACQPIGWVRRLF